MKERLDVLLVKRNLAESREKAKAIIMSGNVFVEDQREDKAGTTFPEDVKIEVRGHVMPYVSRGGLKLEKAIKNFDVSVEGKVCTDVGLLLAVYGLYAAERSCKGVCNRCRTGAVGLETASGSKGSLHGKDQYPLCDTGRYRRTGGLFLH